MPSSGIEAMLKTFELTDQAVKEQIKEQGLEHKIACKKGCSVCCKQVELPILLAEIETIGWYIKDKVGREMRRKIMKKVDTQKPGSLSCPFVLADSCSIYPVRPLSCRNHLILNRACRPDEDIIESRFEDLVRYDNEKMHTALRPLVAVIEPEALTMDPASPGYLELMSMIVVQQKMLSEMDWKGFLNFYLRQK